MSEKEFLDAIGYVDEKLVEEAEFGMLLRKKRTGMLVLIAAILSLLTLAAFASGIPAEPSVWFEAFFGTYEEEAESELTENQNQILHAGLVEIGQSVTCNGYTITLESGLCDGYRALIKCRVDAPEGVVLDGRNYALDYTGHIGFSSGEPGNYSASSYTNYLLEDEDPNDNSITQLLDIIVQPGQNSDFSLADGSVWGFTFSSVMELRGYDEQARWSTLCEGNWDFQVAFQDELLVTNSVELLDKPVRCLWSMQVRNRWIPLRAKVFSLELRGLTATIRYKRPLIAMFEGVHLNKPIYLVLEDGSRVRVWVKMNTYRKDHDEVLCTFDRPVSIEDVAAIEFPGVGRVEVTR